MLVEEIQKLPDGVVLEVLLETARSIAVDNFTRREPAEATLRLHATCKIELLERMLIKKQLAGANNNE